MVQPIFLRAVPSMVPIASVAGEQPPAAEHREYLQQKVTLRQLKASTKQIHPGILQLRQQHCRNPIPTSIRGRLPVSATSPAARAAASLQVRAAKPAKKEGPAGGGALWQHGDAVLLKSGADGGRAGPDVHAQLCHGALPDAGARLLSAAGFGYRVRDPPGQQDRRHLVDTRPDNPPGKSLHPLPRHAAAHRAALHPAGPHHLLQPADHLPLPPSPAARPCSPPLACPLLPV